MKELPTFAALVDSFGKLPGIGSKTAERMAFAVLEMKEEDAAEFSQAIADAKEKIKRCPRCGLYEEDGNCEICSDPTRDHSTCIVVASAKDAIAFEKLGDYKGVYHVLGGLLSPSKGIGESELQIDSLLKRCEEEGIKEVVVATNPTLEGETTALYIARLLEKQNIPVSRLAYGLPVGATLDFADSLTLQRAFQGRKKL